MGSVLASRPDLLAVVEALYAQERNDRLWLTRIVSVMEKLIPDHLGVVVMTVAHEDDFQNPVFLHAQLSRSIERMAMPGIASVENASPASFADAFYPRRPVMIQSDLLRDLQPATREMFLKSRASFGWGDALGIVAHPLAGAITVVSAGFASRRELPANELAILERLASHFESAFRLRLRPESAIAAVLAPDGKLRHLADPSLDRERRDWFGTRIAAIDASRGRRDRADLDPWWGLFAGKYSVVPVEDRDGKRHYLLVDNPPTAEEHARFTLREIDVVRAAARGFAGKHIAYSLGISSAAVSDNLRSAALKVGLPNRHELVRVTASMLGQRPSAITPEQLTQAERDVLELLRRGLTNQQIAELRGRSVNTVKNQVAALMRKTGGESRRALGLTDS